MAKLIPEVGVIPIVALDVSSAAAALALVDRLAHRCRFYKVGSELFTTAGPDIVTTLRARGADVFLDLKFHDIPNTVAGGVRAAARLGARLVTVHASGGATMLRAAVDAAGDQSLCGILAVTVLTSLSSEDVAAAWGRHDRIDTSSEVLRLADLAASVGTHGIVCSGLEAAAVWSRHQRQLALLVPGVRPAGEAVQDQSRVVTPGEAARAGASYIVLGRAVTASADPAGAMDRVNAELAAIAR